MKMEEKHTPGPWEFQKHDSGRYYGNIVGYYSRYETDPQKGNQIRTITIQLANGTEEENKANAELIARAPELLENVAALTKENERLNNQLKTVTKAFNDENDGLREEAEKLKVENDEIISIVNAGPLSLRNINFVMSKENSQLREKEKESFRLLKRAMIMLPAYIVGTTDINPASEELFYEIKSLLSKFEVPNES